MSLTRAQILDFHAAMESHQRSLGVFESVNMHESKGAPQVLGVSAQTWIQQMKPARAASGLNSTTVRMAYRTRVMTSAMATMQDMIDPNVMFAAGTLIEAYSEDFTLGGRVREVDLLGQFGEPLGWDAAYLNMDGKIFRVVDVNAPLIVNDVWEQSP